VFQPEGRRTRLGAREDLLDAAQRCGVGLEDLCAGRGTCGKCKVLVRRGAEHLRPPTAHEARLNEEDRTRGARLACQTRARADGLIVLEVPPEAQRSVQRLQTSGLMPAFRLNPSVRGTSIPIRQPLWALRRSGYELDAGTVDALKQAVARGVRGARLVTWERRQILAVQPAGDPILGMAFDVGSTKLAGFLTDLESGEVLATVSAPNPQMVHGEDIMSRLAYARASEDQERVLHDEVLQALNRLLRQACALAKVPPRRVYHVTAVGNTAMHHLALGLSIDGLSRAPYTPASWAEEVREAGPFGLEANPAARITAPPVVAAFVGSDLVAGVLATRMARARGLQILVDVGTNTEICAGDSRRLVACSSPSGPAFEGAHIRFGMRAADGAIERVAVDPSTLRADYRTIGKGKPRGLCGSALIDLLAELYLAGVLDSRGRFRRVRGSDRIRRAGGERAFVVASAEETAIRRDIVLTQSDVGQLQLAKAAIHAGIEILLDELGRSASEVRALHLAGAFGSYIAPESARTIGMFPDLPLDRVRFVGNTAGSGARLALLSEDERARMRDLARRIEHAPLAGDPRFPRAYAAALPIPHRNPSRFPSVVTQGGMRPASRRR